MVCVTSDVENKEENVDAITRIEIAIAKVNNEHEFLPGLIVSAISCR